MLELNDKETVTEHIRQIVKLKREFREIFRTIEYEYEGKPIGRPKNSPKIYPLEQNPPCTEFLRSILKNHLHFKSWSKIYEIQPVIVEYHFSRGGGEILVNDLEPSLRQILWELYREGIYHIKGRSPYSYKLR